MRRPPTQPNEWIEHHPFVTRVVAQVHRSWGLVSIGLARSTTASPQAGSTVTTRSVTARVGQIAIRDRADPRGSSRAGAVALVGRVPLAPRPFSSRVVLRD